VTTPERPVQLPAGVLVPAGSARELATFLRLAVDLVSGRYPAAGVKLPKPSARLSDLLSVLDAQARDHAAASAPGTPPIAPRPAPRPRSGATVTTAQAADRLGYSARWVRQLARKGHLVAVQNEFGWWVYDAADVAGYQEERGA
jgi:hypothetical protein